MKFIEIINEAKQVGILYHYTSIFKINQILNSDYLKPYSAVKTSENFISFTRNKNFHKIKREGIFTDIRLTIDGNKLSEKYKIKPFNYFNKQSIKNKIKFYKNLRNTYDEDEERINTKKIENLKNYIIEITVFIPQDLKNTDKFYYLDITKNLEILRKLCKEKI